MVCTNGGSTAKWQVPPERENREHHHPPSHFLQGSSSRGVGSEPTSGIMKIVNCKFDMIVMIIIIITGTVHNYGIGNGE